MAVPAASAVIAADEFRVLDRAHNSHACRQPAEAQDAASDASGSQRAQQRREYVIDAAFPALPASVPLTFALTMEACLSPTPEERPAFAQVLTLLADVQAEVALGEYVNAVGRVQVSSPRHRPREPMP